jgi:hypothetical protein
MANVVKIRTLTAPPTRFSEFDPGAYLSELEFCQRDSPTSEEDRDGLARVRSLACAAGAGSSIESVGVVGGSASAGKRTER